MIFQHRSQAQKPRSKCYMSLKGESSWWCCRSRVPLYIELTPSAVRRDSDDVIVKFGVAGVWTV